MMPHRKTDCGAYGRKSVITKN